MPRAIKKPTFEIIVGKSFKGPEEAAKDAERKARKAGGEQVSIAADVVFGSGTAPDQVGPLLDNIARNMYQLVQCTCPEFIGQKIIKPGVPPPARQPTGGGPGFTEWVVYILIKH